MNTNSVAITANSVTKTFNHPQRFIEGWYWALPSQQLRQGQVKALTLLGKNLAIYRNLNGQAITVDAYCPHMGAHLAAGKVEGEGLRCFFHNWKFAPDGSCVDIPCLDKVPQVKIKTWETAERYGMVWVWTGENKPAPLPFVPELEQEECRIALGSRFIKNCHPNVMMINAIDAQHFNSVHNLPLEIIFAKTEINQHAIQFSNTTRGGENSWFVKLIRPFYQQAVTYSMCYWYGSTGTVTIGPDFLHFHIMFTLRLLENGKTEGQTILITKKRPEMHGWLINRVLLWLTKLVGNYFAKGDTKIFQTIKFDFKTPTKADLAIMQFIQHVEKQPALVWESWEKV